MVRNGYIGFGGHLEIQVSYKVLWLEVSNKAPILHSPVASHWTISYKEAGVYI
jgi:hypothetical protein